MSQGRARRGVTLLELLVVLAMLGLLLAIAAPAFIVPTARGRGNLEEVLTAARRTAVLRAEPVTLSIDDGGAWSLTGDAESAATPIATGTLEDAPGRAKVRVSPLGLCVAEMVPANAPTGWSVVGCGPVFAGGAPR